MIKNVIFDFGGVLMNLDYQLTFTQLGDVMGLQIQNDQIPAHIYKIMLGYEKGEINTETFLWNLQKESANITPQPDKLIKAWNAMLLGWNPDRFSFLQELKNNYGLYLLCNTNDLHLEWTMRDLDRNHGIQDFNTRFFDQTFYSHQIKMRKPELQIFEKVISDTGIDPLATLFIDDRMENVLKAREAGINATWHDPNLEIIDALFGYIAEFDK